ncbi:hypothetical protein ABC345_13490 [Shouchella sp. 1P09AA]|uniref:hypothetical protein n=1 Tax=unclassified Shouchella TaxID=2893065 RepID=UPI0039A18721
MEQGIPYEKLEEKKSKLSSEKKVLFEEVVHYMEAASFSKRKRYQLLHQVLDEWIYAEKHNLELDVNQKNIYTYCEKRTKGLPQMSTSLKTALLLRGGLLLFVVYFVLQLIIQTVGLFEPNIQAASFSFLPILLLAGFGLLGVYVFDKSNQKERSFMWKMSGILLQAAAFLLFFASMRLWDGVLTIQLNLLNSVILVIFFTVTFFLVGKWKQQLEEKETERDQNDVILFS